MEQAIEAFREKAKEFGLTPEKQVEALLAFIHNNLPGCAKFEQFVEELGRPTREQYEAFKRIVDRSR